MTPLAVAACLMLAACAGSGGWQKPGADAGTVGAAYAACRGAAAGAAETERRIDADITASRDGDWQRSRTAAVHRDTLRAQAAAHVDAVIDACMRARGFRRAR